MECIISKIREAMEWGQEIGHEQRTVSKVKRDQCGMEV